MAETRAEIRTEHTGGVAVLTVHDPDRRNALTTDLSAELAEAVTRCEADDSVHALVVTGADPAFCAGADLAALADASEAAEQERGLRAVYAGFLAVAESRLPTIAAVNGAAVGAGLNLALAADVRIAGPKARFDARFLKLGIHPGGGMTWMLQRAVGPQTARAMVLFGQILGAGAAVDAGLAHSVAEDPVAAAVEFAEPATQAPRELVLATKASMRTTAALDAHAGAVDIELTPQVESLNSPAFAERLAAMRAKISHR
ncbi:enoyl-CoA hydratase [Sciscionella sediminilitoris]|uniref:enoyl-CoA hydratase n=1 Tax=Sciscionella sediminilitoris TaxID=1445613 RepID=UPI0004DF1298|nr:enoyl-CoA hydratase [Sciscionella sp. SE31]